MPGKSPSSRNDGQSGISDPGYSEEEIASSQKPLLAMTAKAGSAIQATGRKKLLHAREITEFSQ